MDENRVENVDDDGVADFALEAIFGGDRPRFARARCWAAGPFLRFECAPLATGDGTLYGGMPLLTVEPGGRFYGRYVVRRQDRGQSAEQC